MRSTRIGDLSNRMQTAQQITKKSNSNLAIALMCLPRDRRQDMVTFYAFCRLIDDIADANTDSESVRHHLLDQWTRTIEHHTIDPLLNPLQQEILSIIERYGINRTHILEIIEGCRSDISNIQTFDTWDDLKKYTYRVASCVGLVSVKIFGCKNDQSYYYAENLGHALQITNILRDVGDDLKTKGRIYIPLEELEQFSYSQHDLRNHRYDEQFVKLMRFQAARAEDFYAQTVKNITAEDESALRPSEVMRKIYYSILKKMKLDDFQVFAKRYRISKAKKIFHLIT
jgi:15-cis-phytoene synthase